MEDLIRRSDAIKAVIEWYGCKPNDIEAFEKIIEAIPSAESTGDLDNAIYEYVKEGLMDNPYDRPQEWIPCEERMPMYNVDVLVYRPTMGQKIIVDTYCGFYGEDIDDLDEWYEGWGISREHAVTAWMPLPKPWKGEDDDNL